MSDFILKKMMSAPGQCISYADYMNLALYDEAHGYYMKHGVKIGRFGDFVTSSHISDVFGKLFASFFIQLIKMGQVVPHICELGGGDGTFARSVLKEWKEKSPHTYEMLTYHIIEASPYQRAKQKEALAPFEGKALQYKSFDEFQRGKEAFSGIVFSNEFFDALPVHVVTKEHGMLYELFVTVRDGQLAEEKRPLENEEILLYLRERNISLQEGQRLEIPLALKCFLLKSAPIFEQCVMITVDYGYTDEEWKLPARRQGSLRGYYQHQLISNPLAHPGQMDITAHVQWDALRMYGERAGWNWVDMMRQDRFLLAAGILSYLTEHYDPNPFSEQSRRNRAIRSLVTDEGISAFFQVAIQQKNVRIAWENVWKELDFLQ
ncbi:class I SAM-dependent methyltransferase [Anoxybacteroides tepidamans]|uniref:class I SAM-dependent methyltransferase n=1 Tax=Anoxybacteroides tepidamans TaxID=265948 RepID=UPI000486CEF3|nr:SAM-dependent methyltransferase [Anoxybacillus tepidamans]